MAVLNLGSQPASTSATLFGQGDNVPATNKLGFLWGTTPGGPYPNQTPTVAGDTTVGQAFNQTITGLTPGVQYYFVAVELDAGNAIVNQSIENAFISTSPIVLNCWPACVENVGEGLPPVPWPDCVPVSVPCPAP